MENVMAMVGDGLGSYLFFVLLALAGVFALVLTGLTLAAVVLYRVDVRQEKHAIRRNYPLFGRFRDLFEKAGVFFRNYFSAMDREELPFNRAQRTWVYRAAKKLNNNQSFGSTRPVMSEGNIVFVNSLFPVLENEASKPADVTIGEQSESPYTSNSLLNISGMSYGALSKPAVQALSKGAALSGCWLNTGEGGIAPYHEEYDADIVVQIGTAKYGVRDALGQLSDQKLRQLAENPKVKMFEIKLSQGAKPGKGGILPAEKVTEEIARLRGISVGQPSLSPNRMPEIGSVDELLDFIARVREQVRKPVGIKLVMGDDRWLDEFCEKILRRGVASAPDFITLDGGNGGSGAAPLTLIDNMGLVLGESLPLLIDGLTRAGLRSRIKVICSGKLINPVDVAWAYCMGTDFVTTARGFMFALGCIQSLQCGSNACPTGVATHDARLQRGLIVPRKALRVAGYQQQMSSELSLIAHSCGV